MDEDEELRRAIAFSLQHNEGAAFDEHGVKEAIEKLGHHRNRAEGDAAINTLQAYARNILQHPGVDKYRHIKCTNAALTGRVLSVEAGKEVMERWGWRPDQDKEHLSLPSEVTAHDTRIVLSALENLHLTEEQRRHKAVVEEERRRQQERAHADKAERERIKRQLALDRIEVSQQITRPSHAMTPNPHPGMHRLPDVSAH